MGMLISACTEELFSRNHLPMAFMRLGRLVAENDNIARSDLPLRVRLHFKRTIHCIRCAAG